MLQSSPVLPVEHLVRGSAAEAADGYPLVCAPCRIAVAAVRAAELLQLAGDGSRFTGDCLTAFARCCIGVFKTPTAVTQLTWWALQGVLQVPGKDSMRRVVDTGVRHKRAWFAKQGAGLFPLPV